MDLNAHQDIYLTTVNIINVDLLWSASRVVEIAYAARGYFPNEGGFKKLIHLSWLAAKSFSGTFSKKVTTIVALEGKKVVGTLSVYFDGGKLPIEDLFPDTLSLLRKTSAKIVYLGTFATSEEFRGKASLVASLFQEAVKIGTEALATKALCVVNPAHVSFYRHLGFTEIARKDNMPGLHNATAVLLQLDAGSLRRDVINRMAKNSKSL